MGKWTKYRKLTGRTKLFNGGEIYRFDIVRPGDPRSLDVLDRTLKYRVQYVKAETLNMMEIHPDLKNCKKATHISFWRKMLNFFSRFARLAYWQGISLPH